MTYLSNLGLPKYSIVKGMLITFILIGTGCSKYTPKPKGYNRIDNLEAEYIEYNFPKFSFQYSDEVRIDTLQAKEKGEIWFNIVYSKYNAVVYCTYLPISRSVLPKVLEDSHRLAYSHALKADEIDQRIFENKDVHVSGTLYSIGGSVATPAQFYLTDSIGHFFRGSFYYSEKVNTDSVAPITDFIIQDIENMISTFAWK